MAQRVLATFVTTTSYGTWLPGDARGYIADGRLLPANPRYVEHARSLMSESPVLFTAAQRDRLFQALLEAALEFQYRLVDATVEAWHLHWIVDHGYDSAYVMIGRLKTRMRQALDCGRIWTEGYSHRPLFTQAQLLVARRYIARHNGCRMLDGRILSKSPPSEGSQET